MNTEVLRLFVIVANEGSFSAAARKMFITPSAVVQKMHALENEIGVPLFLKNASGIQLTAAGEIFLSGVRDSLQSLDTAISKTKEYNRQDNSFNLVMFTDSAVEVYKRFCLDNPQYACNYHVYPSDQAEKLFEQFLDDRIQIIEWIPKPKDSIPNVEALVYSSDQLYCVVSRKHELANNEHITPQQLSRFKLLIHSHRHDGCLDAIKKIFKEAGISDFSYSFISGEPNEIIQLCNQNGVVLTSQTFARSLPLVSLPIIPKIEIHYSLAYKKYANDAVMNFIRYVKKHE